MDDNRLPKQVLYGELSTGERRLDAKRSAIKIKSRPYSRNSKSHLICWRPKLQTAVGAARNATRAPKNSSTNAISKT